MLDHYLHTACPAALLIHPTSQTMILAHISLGVMLEEQGRDADALGHTRQALELFTAAPHT